MLEYQGKIPGVSVSMMDKAYAAQENVTDKSSEALQIKTYNDLLEAAAHTDGSYILMADIDMSRAGADGWKPWILMVHLMVMDILYTIWTYILLQILQLRHMMAILRNMIHILQVFLVITDGAVISNLNITGAYIELGGQQEQTQKSIFAAVLAGYMNNTTISNCKVEASYAALTSASKMWGTAGIAGFGNGLIENTTSDVTLVCTDADPDVTDRDEQFMGGIYADGYIDVKDCTVNIDGYISERGYVHSGGIAGLYILYPVSGSYVADIAGNTINGMITFFEDNTDRRAYCRALAGERMNVYTTSRDNTDNFTRNEIYDYTQVLRPENYERKLYTVDNPYESSEASAISETKENNPVSVSSGELVEGVNDNARQEEKPGFKFGRRVLFSGISEAARAAIIIVIAIAAISAYYFITRYIRRKK